MKGKRIAALLPAAAAVLFLVYANEVFTGVRDAIDICLCAAIPSLFPMLFITTYIAESGLAEALGKRLSPVSDRVFGLPGPAGTVMLMCMLGGYPTGAAMTASLYEKRAISEPMAKRLIMLCVSAGPAFVISTVGSTYFASKKIGMLLLAGQVVSVLTLGFLTRRECRECAASESEIEYGKRNTFVNSAGKAASSMLSICIYIVLFGAFTSLISSLGIIDASVKLLSALGISERVSRGLLLSVPEVTAGCLAAAKAGIGVTGFAVGFGGLAVHFQIYALASKIKISRLRFTALRLIQGIICGLVSLLLSKLIDLPETAVPVSAAAAQRAFPSTTGSALLLIMCLMCVICAPDINYRSLRPLSWRSLSCRNPRGQI